MAFRFVAYFPGGVRARCENRKFDPLTGGYNLSGAG
jgi:hypothetical protein